MGDSVQLSLLEAELGHVEDHLDGVHVVLVGRVEDHVDLELLTGCLGFLCVMGAQVVEKHAEGLAAELLTEQLAVLNELEFVDRLRVELQEDEPTLGTDGSHGGLGFHARLLLVGDDVLVRVAEGQFELSGVCEDALVDINDLIKATRGVEHLLFDGVELLGDPGSVGRLQHHIVDDHLAPDAQALVDLAELLG